jgi:hypothetical protein
MTLVTAGKYSLDLPRMEAGEEEAERPAHDRHPGGGGGRDGGYIGADDGAGG